MNNKHPLNSTLTNLKSFKENLNNHVAPANTDGWSLSNLPAHFWETLGECINDLEQYIKIENPEKKNTKKSLMRRMRTT